MLTARRPYALDPVSWTSSERRIRWPEWDQWLGTAGTTAVQAGAVRLVLDEGKTIRTVARELDLTPSSLANWVRHAQPGGVLAETRHSCAGSSRGSVRRGTTSFSLASAEARSRSLSGLIRRLRQTRFVEGVDQSEASCQQSRIHRGHSRSRTRKRSSRPGGDVHA